MADERLKFIIEVDKNTGAISVVGDEFAKLGGSVKQAQGATSELKAEIASLLSAGALVAFLKSSVMAAEEEVQVMNRLQTQLKAVGENFAGAAERARSWAESIQQGTRFSDEMAIGGLSKAIQRVGDFGEAQKITKLAMDLSVATGKEFNAVLDSLSLAAAGNQRGFEQLRREFTGQLSGVKDVKTALDTLNASYGGTAERSKTLTDDTAKLKNAFDDVQEGIGTRLAPTITKILTELKNDLPVISNVLTGATAAIQILLEGIFTSGSLLKDFVSGIIKSLTLILSRDLDGASKAIDKMFSDMLASATRAQADMKKVLENASAAILANTDATNEAVKNKDAEAAEFKKVKLKSDLNEAREEEKKSFQTALEIEKIHQQTSLSQKNLSMSDQVKIIEESAKRQVEIIRQAEEDGVLTTAEAAMKRAELHAQTEKEITKINQQFVVDSSRELQSWVAQNSNANAQVLRMGMNTANQLAAGFGRAFADMIMDEKSFAASMEALFRQLVSTIIAELMRIMVVKALIGIGFGAPVPGLAVGGRVTSRGVFELAEGGEAESVVPDSQAHGFALGVLAGGGPAKGRGTGSRASGLPASGDMGGGGGGDTILVNINITGTWNLDSPESRRQLFNVIAEEFSAESAHAIQAARRAGDLNSKYSGRAA